MQYRTRALLVLASLLFGAPAAADDIGAAIATARAAAGGEVRMRRAGPDGPVAFLAAPGGISLPVGRGAGADQRVRAFLAAHGALFGLGAGDATGAPARLDAFGLEHVRLCQVIDGVPVAAVGLSLYLC